jgi:polyisoprenoid-binding protein YceI
MLAPLLAALALAAPAGRTFAVDPAASTLRYTLVHKLHTVEGTSRKIEGRAVLQPDGRILAMVRAPIASFDSGDSNRDAHMQEAMEVNAFPFVVAKAAGTFPAVAPAGGAAAPAAVTLEGELDLHGVKRPVSLPLELVLSPDGTARAKGRFDVSLDAHRIERPSLLFVKVDDAVRIDVDLVLREVKP